MNGSLVLGTAGHIDHGKTALVRALSGVDCDRLPEEKARGITIELGFAPLDLPSGRRLSVVDVPGHEKLVRTMVAGATGMDLVLFVIAADEGIMPQTREHLAICSLLGVHRGVVALTKIDAVDRDLAELARLEVEEELGESALADAPVIPVSAQRGDGLDELRQALDTAASDTPPAVQNDHPAWLPVDRVFTMKGFGTVVTGTLRGSRLHTSQGVEILADHVRDVAEARVRGLQVHGSTSEHVDAGSRCAINLQGIDVAAAPRGSVVASPGRLDWRPRVGARVELLPDAPPVRNNTSLSFHVGTSERLARVVVLDGRGAIEPGDSALVELRFDQPVIALEGDRFILRGFSRLPRAGWTVGGGVVLDAAPLRGRIPRADRLAELEVFDQGDRKASLALRLSRAGPRGVLKSELARQVLSLDGLDGMQIGAERVVAREAFEPLIERVAEAIAAHHEAHPTDPVVGLAAVTGGVGGRVPEDVVRAALEAAARKGRLEMVGSGFCLPGHRAHVADPELQDTLRANLEQSALAAEPLSALAKSFDVELAALRRVAEHLAREGILVRVASDHFFAKPAIEELRGRVVSHLEAQGEIDPAAYKQLTGQTRKYTVPIMEYFDTEKLTVRRGNVRVLRGRR